MKFYLEIIPQVGAPRRAHIANEDDGQARKCLCPARLNPKKWMLVEEISNNTHLCKMCNQLADFPARECPV